MSGHYQFSFPPNKSIPGNPPSASQPKKSDLFASSRIPPCGADLQLPKDPVSSSSSSSSSSDVSPTGLRKGPPELFLSPMLAGASSSRRPTPPSFLPPDYPAHPEAVAASRDYSRRTTGFFEPHIIDFAERPTPRCFFERQSCSSFMSSHPVAMCHDCYIREMRKKKKLSGLLFSRGCFGAWLAGYTAIIVTIVVLIMVQQRKAAMKYQRDQFWRDQQGHPGSAGSSDAGMGL